MSTPSHTNHRPPNATPNAAPSNRGARRRSRECVVQGLYTWLLNHEPEDAVSAGTRSNTGAGGVIEAYLRDGKEFAHCDLDLFKSLLGGALEHATQLRSVFAAHIDRSPNELSPVEHSLLLLGTYELLFCLDTPLRVVINEAVEISKSFGGNDAYKYINGVLDKVAASARPVEFAAAKRK